MLEQIQRQEEITAKAENTLSAEYAGKLLFTSFRLSQGAMGTQLLIYDYLHKMHPEWRIEGDTDDLTQEILRKTHAFLKPGVSMENFEVTHSYHKRVRASEISNEVTAQIHAMRLTLRKSLFQENLIPKLTESIVTSDFLYLSRPEGRARKQKSDSPTTTYSDPFFSHFYYFGVLGKTTGLPEYDQMYSEITDYAQDEAACKREGLEMTKVNFICNKYRETHS